MTQNISIRADQVSLFKVEHIDGVATMFIDNEDLKKMAAMSYANLESIRNYEGRLCIWNRVSDNTRYFKYQGYIPVGPPLTHKGNEYWQCEEDTKIALVVVY